MCTAAWLLYCNNTENTAVSGRFRNRASASEVVCITRGGVSRRAHHNVVGIEKVGIEKQQEYEYIKGYLKAIHCLAAIHNTRS